MSVVTLNTTRKKEITVLITLFGKRYHVDLVEAKYGDGSTALEVIDSEDGSPFGRLTVCVPGTQLKK